jgi:hypothetical protein
MAGCVRQVSLVVRVEKESESHVSKTARRGAPPPLYFVVPYLHPEMKWDLSATG